MVCFAAVPLVLRNSVPVYPPIPTARSLPDASVAAGPWELLARGFCTLTLATSFSLSLLPRCACLLPTSLKTFRALACQTLHFIMWKWCCSSKTSTFCRAEWSTKPDTPLTCGISRLYQYGLGIFFLLPERAECNLEILLWGNSGHSALLPASEQDKALKFRKSFTLFSVFKTI